MKRKNLKSLFLAGLIATSAVTFAQAQAGRIANVLANVASVGQAVNEVTERAGSGAIETLLEMRDSAAAGAEELANLRALSNLNAADQAFEPNYSPDGMPRVPISCGNMARTPGSLTEFAPDCRSCYEDATKDVDFARRILERLRAIGSSTSTMTNKAIAFGDSVSGIHGYSGLYWQTQVKPGIEKAHREMRGAYTEKYTALLTTLRKGLDKVAACEAKHFQNPDWFNRFGFMFYAFMEHRYAPDQVLKSVD